MSSIDKRARKLCRHIVTYREISQILVAVKGMQGLSTKAIARAMGMSQSKAQYRITKAQNLVGRKFRADYRNGESPLAQAMLKATQRMASNYVRDEIAPRLVQLASAGVPRT